MHRVGLGGFQNFDAALATPKVVEHRLAYMTPEWKDAFKYAIVLGDQLGLEMAIAGSPGWSESGGPCGELRESCVGPLKPICLRQLRSKNCRLSSILATELLSRAEGIGNDKRVIVRLP